MGPSRLLMVVSTCVVGCLLRDAATAKRRASVLAGQPGVAPAAVARVSLLQAAPPSYVAQCVSAITLASAATKSSTQCAC